MTEANSSTSTERTLHVSINGQQRGPYSERAIREQIANGRLTPSTPGWSPGEADWRPLSELLDGLEELWGTSFEILEREYYRMPKITLRNSSVVVEAGAMHYMRGAIQIKSRLPTLSGWVKSQLSKERAVRPLYEGTGEVYLEPFLGEFCVLDLHGYEWVLDQGSFIACDAGVEIGIFSNKNWAGLFGGEGIFQTSVKGQGKVMFQAPGPLQRIDLRDDRLVVDGSFAVARSASLRYNLGRATRSAFGSWTSGEGLVHTFEGTGAVFLAPVPSRHLALFKEIGWTRAAISAKR